MPDYIHLNTVTGTNALLQNACLNLIQKEDCRYVAMVAKSAHKVWV